MAFPAIIYYSSIRGTFGPTIYRAAADEADFERQLGAHHTEVRINGGKITEETFPGEFEENLSCIIYANYNEHMATG